MLSTATRSSARVRSRALQALLSLLLSFSLALLLVPADAWATTSEATGATSDADAVSTTPDGATPVVADKDDKATTTPEAQVDESMEGTADETSQAAVSQDTASATSDDEGARAEAVSATIRIVGVDASGSAQSWTAATTYDVDQGTTAAQLSERLFADKGIEADYGTGSWGWYLNTITSPYSGQTLGWDESTGRYWQLFVDGQPSSVGAGSVTLQAGDEVTWAYSAYGDELPTGSDVVIDPTATRPDYSSDWPGYMSGNASGAVVARSTPASETGAAWMQTLKSADDWRTSVSDPIVVNGDLYLVVGDQLQVRSASDGSLKSSVQLAASADSICRLVYADGVVVVPLHGGRLQALTADTLATVWLTDALPADAKNGDQQALSTLTVHDGSVYFGTAAADWTSSTSGYLRRVSISDGTVVWTIHDDGCGYYWDGVAFVGDVAVVADDSGRVVAYDADAGTELHAFSLGAGVRSTPVASGDAVYVVSTDGVLHKLRVGADGSLTETGSVSFGTSSTTTPTVFGDDVVVAGTSKEGYANSWGGTSYYGLLAVVDAASLALKSSVTTLSDGSHIPADVKSAPLVSRTSGGAYAYFTSNSTPGAVYACLLGADRAFTLFTPAEEQQQYCMASVVADGDGSLYYVNDSGTLFKLPHAGAETTPAKSDDSSSNASNGDAADGGSGDDSGGQGTQPAASTQVTRRVAGDASSGGTSSRVASATSTSAGTWLLGRFSQGALLSTHAEAASAGAAGDASGRLPLWPVVGMGAGAVALAGVCIGSAASRKRRH